ncbi:hypothetical protein [Loktanella sp. Alg231-35]|uniref:hypothetical protein n=1 Tax=Loktanella sp. Alg231-35 TaxID=1922220 RepID=UPI000D54BA05|nr:hypothetical protein [Loktanella sp. Alg231-35]
MFQQRAPTEQIDRYTGPYERWIYAPELGFPFAFPAIKNGAGTHFSALMEGQGMLEQKPGIDIRVPPLWSEDPQVTPFAIHDKGTAPTLTEDDTQDTKLSKILHALDGPRFRLNMPINPKTWPDTYDPATALNGWTATTPPKAIIGVIDDGIPFVHRAFLDSTGKSRINLCWLQAAKAENSAAVPFGREVTNTEIDTLRADHGRNEMAMYRASGAIDRDLPELGTVLTHHATHGGHIAGIAAGNDCYVGADALPDDVQILAVQLPNTIAWDTSGIGKEMMMLSAMEYIMHRARAIADRYNVPEIPLIVNFSYGWSANRHDGQSSFELAVENLVTQRKGFQPLTELVMPTGNNFANDMHARFMEPDMTDGIIEFGWKIMPDDRTSSYLEIWLPPDFDPAGWDVVVTPPEGTDLDVPGFIPVAPDPNLANGDPRRFTELERGGANIGQLSVDKHLGNRWRIMIALVPTVPDPAEFRRTPVGTWTIKVDMSATPLAGAQAMDVWVQRDDDPTQLGTGGQQSRLVDLAGNAAANPLPPIRGYGCINGIGTAPSTIRVAGYDQTTREPSPYSGSSALAALPGGDVIMGPEAPVISAVADQGAFRPGLPSIGVLSGSGARIVGTSAAAAAASRLMVANIAADLDPKQGFEPLPEPGPDVTLEAAKNKARSGTYRAPPVCGSKPPQPAVNGGGAGV